MKISCGKLGTMEYGLRLDGGELLESSEERGPIKYVQGSGQMLKGLEVRVEGLSAGDEHEGEVPAAEAYGDEEDMPTLEIPAAEFPGGGAEVNPGLDFQATDPEGNPITFTVLEVNDETVKVRLNHPLAGKAISFKVKILDVSEPQA